MGDEDRIEREAEISKREEQIEIPRATSGWKGFVNDLLDGLSGS